MDKIAITVWIVIGINALVSYKGFNDISFFRKYEFHIGSIRAGEHYRMFTNAFLHGDIMHILFNMFALYVFAPIVIFYMGILGFLLLYAASLLAGSLLTLFFHRNDFHYRAIGASGAVMGVLYSAILFAPDQNLYLFFAIPIPTIVFGIGYLLYSIYGMKAKNDNIGHTAHFGGAIAGFAITLSRYPNMIYDNTLMVVLLTIPIIILLVMAKMGKI